jgi:hypothetical protein
MLAKVDKGNKSGKDYINVQTSGGHCVYRRQKLPEPGKCASKSYKAGSILDYS